MYVHPGRGAIAGVGSCFHDICGQEAEEGMLVFDLHLPLACAVHQSVEGPLRDTA